VGNFGEQHWGLSVSGIKPAAQRMSQASRDELLTTLREEVHALRAENHALRLQLATRIGQDRALSRDAPVSDM